MRSPMWLLCSMEVVWCFFFFNDTATTEIYTLSLHDALPICLRARASSCRFPAQRASLSNSRNRRQGGLLRLRRMLLDDLAKPGKAKTFSGHPGALSEILV